MYIIHAYIKFKIALNKVRRIYQRILQNDGYLERLLQESCKTAVCFIKRSYCYEISNLPLSNKIFDRILEIIWQLIFVKTLKSL